MKLKSLLLSLILPVLMSTNFATQAGKPPFTADLIIINARIHTMDQGQPLAEAVAISGNRIIAVGTPKENRETRRRQEADAHSRCKRPARAAGIQRCARAFHVGRFSIVECRSALCEFAAGVCRTNSCLRRQAAARALDHRW